MDMNINEAPSCNHIATQTDVENFQKEDEKTYNEAKRKIKAYIDRIENLEQNKRYINTDIKYVYDELANEGYDKQAVKRLVVKRQKDQQLERIIEDNMHQYELALGMIYDA